MIPLLLPGLTLTALIAWSIGGNDAANSIDAIVGARVLSIKKALMIFAIAQFIGAVVQGFMVMKTLGRGIVYGITITEAIAASTAAFLWITIATIFRMPVSTTHSIVSAVIGIGVVRVLQGLETSINIDVVSKIILSWVVSPLSAMAIAIPLYYLFSYITSSLSKNELLLKLILIAMSIFSAYSFGANDVGNATGVYVTITSNYLGLPDMITMRFLSIYASIFIAVGGISIGRRVVETLAFKITRLDVNMALAAEAANALTVWLFTTVPYMLFGYGLPISTTYATAGSIVGVGIAKYKGFSGVSLKTVIFITTAWVLTLPLAALASISIYHLLKVFIGEVV